MTENHSYKTPAEGTLDWHIPLNENFKTLDRDIEIRDTDANRTNYEPKAGSKFVATDSKNVYIGDGSSWNYLATLGGIQGRIYVQDTEPADAQQGDIWFDTSTN